MKNKLPHFNNNIVKHCHICNIPTTIFIFNNKEIKYVCEKHKKSEERKNKINKLKICEMDYQKL